MSPPLDSIFTANECLAVWKVTCLSMPANSVHTLRYISVVERLLGRLKTGSFEPPLGGRKEMAVSLRGNTSLSLVFCICLSMNTPSLLYIRCSHLSCTMSEYLSPVKQEKRKAHLMSLYLEGDGVVESTLISSRVRYSLLTHIS